MKIVQGIRTYRAGQGGFKFWGF